MVKNKKEKASQMRLSIKCCSLLVASHGLQNQNARDQKVVNQRKTEKQAGYGPRVSNVFSQSQHDSRGLGGSKKGLPIIWSSQASSSSSSSLSSSSSSSSSCQCSSDAVSVMVLVDK